MGIRIAAALVLAVQLTQLAGPALCHPGGRTVPCHETMPAGAPQLAASAPAQQMPCAQAAMCTVPAVALPGAAVALAAPGAASVAAPAPAALQPGDQPPPLSPPPQA